MSQPTNGPMMGPSSLRKRLPLLISGLLVVVVAAVSWSAFLTIEDALIAAAKTRLSSVTQRLADLLGQSTTRGLADARLIVADSAFAIEVTSPTPASHARVLQIMSERQSRSRLPISLALWSKAGTRVAAVGTELPAMLSVPRPVGIVDSASLSNAWVSPLMKSDSGIVYEVVVPVLGKDGTVVGHVAAYSMLRSGQEAATIASLIGTEASMMIGNETGDVWTDLSKLMVGPTHLGEPGQLIEFNNAAGVRQIGVASRISATPWLVMVQMPRSDALAPVTRFVINIAGILVVCIALGAMGAWVLSNRVTAPLAEVSRAAEDVARGDYARRVSISRDDEIGSLAKSFNTMAEKIHEASQEQFEHTRQLELANVELRESESRYRQLVDVSPDALFVHRNQRILFGNPSAVAIVGASNARDLIGKSMLDLVPAGERMQFEERLDAAQRGRLRLPLAEIKLQRFDGAQLNVETASTPFVMEGEAAALTVVRDVTERVRLEDRMRQAQKMEAIGQLAGGVAHDFNNLLTVITSYSGMLLQQIPEDQQAWADIKEISDAADRAAALTRQLLAFSRQQVLKPQVVDLNPITAEMEKMLRRIIPASIQLATRLDPDLGRVSADPGQLEQVLMNLAVNARDAMPAGGALVIETSNVRIGEDDAAMFIGAVPGPYVQLSVSDTGLGITAERQAHIFEPFYTTKEPGKGTGLGLSTVYGIVKQSGGHIWVYSEPGQGTIFKVYFPRVDAAATQEKRLDAEVPNERGTETILLAEDEAPVRAAARTILERWGYVVLEASTGATAVDICARERGRIDVLVTDMVMPDTNGRQLATRIREMLPNVAIVYMSGYTEEAMLRQSAAEPGAVFVQKPFTPELLTRRLREAIVAAKSKRSAV